MFSPRLRSSAYPVSLHPAVARWLIICLLSGAPGALAVGGAVTLPMMAAAGGTSIVVNSKDDVADGADGKCTLREAITAANSDATAGSVPGECLAGSGDDTISFDASVFTPSGSHTISLTGVLPDLNSNITLAGPGAAVLTVQRSTASGTFSFRIFNIPSGTVNISGLTIRNGRNDSQGGGINSFGTLTVTDCVFSDNLSFSGSGGGLFSSGTLTITGSKFSNNSATFGSGLRAYGGSNDSYVVTITDCDISGNSALNGHGGGLQNSGAIMTITNSTISNNSTPGGTGGGIHNQGRLTVTNSTISNNSTESGGGVHNGGRLTLTRSTVSNNSANITGGAIYNQGVETIINSTLSGNTGQSGGGITNRSGAVTGLTNTTIANNRAAATSSDQGGGIYLIGGGTFTLNNTIVAQNFRGTSPDTTPSDIAVEFPHVTATGSYNLIGTGGSGGLSNGSNNNLVGVADPKIAALASNGGPTHTHALLSGSPALDAGNNGLAIDQNAQPLSTDQRGQTRLVDSDGNATAIVDIGAYELQSQSIAPTFTGGTPPQSGSAGAFYSFTFTASGNPQPTFSISAGSAPPGLTLATGGQLSGVPTTVGSYNFTVTASNGNAQVATQNVTINIINGGGFLGFNSAAYIVSEGDGFLNISVTRTGDKSVPATVKYSTSDATDANFSCIPHTTSSLANVASRKCDYHIATGTLRFAPGEDTKQFTLSFIDDIYVESSESLTLTLSNPKGATLDQNATATVTITNNDGLGSPNPIDNTRFFVRQLYVDLLSREPDPAGWNGWTTRIDQCGKPDQPPPPCDRVTVAGDGFLRSGEFFDRQFFVIRLYRTGFGRILRYDEVSDLAYVSGFLTAEELELNKRELVDEIAARPEFINQYNPLSNAAYVATLLQTARVSVPQNIQDEWATALDTNQKTRAQVLREISERPEVSARYAHEAQVVSAYYGFFTRNPDGAYLNYLQRLDSGEINLADLANAFINASEYRQRFGQ